MTKPFEFNAGPCFCVITGASQGIGRAMTVACTEQMKPGSLVVLLARNGANLEQTKSLCKSSGVEIVTRSINLSIATLEEMNALFSDILSDKDTSKFINKLIIHNAGSVGDVTVAAADLNSITDWRDYFALNVFNVAILNSSFMKAIDHSMKNTFIVNVSSLCGLQPFAGLAIYGSGKAAREMYFRVLAEEIPELNVLNYAPGPVWTDMVQTVITNAGNATLKKNFTEMQTKNQYLQPEETVRKFLAVLTDGKYKSGDHVDYYD